MFSIVITISAAFLTALLLGLVLTPVAARLGRRFGALDKPNARKVHAGTVPRSGGLAIIAAFFLGHFLLLLTGESMGRFSVNWDFICVFWIGVFFAAGIGVVDDFKRVPSSIKLAVQILAATAAFLGGIRIEFFSIMQTNVHFSYMTSYLLTVFWFVLLMNAINLIDGLDGLAAGVVIFSAAVMTILMLVARQERGALAFAALAGATLGFLRYNFNPASVFMGDGGSYFLGYALACLSIQYGSKSHMGLSLLIPLLALGIPIFDVIVSPIRRFIIGQKIFKADKGHIHHRLLAMGLTTKKAVLILYCASSILALSAFFLVNMRSEKSGFIFFLLGVAAIVFMRKLGYFEYLALEKIFGWLHDIRDVAGFTRGRRTFLGIEMSIRESKSIDEMWKHVCTALTMKEFEKGHLVLTNGKDRASQDIGPSNYQIGIRLRSVDGPDNAEEEGVNGRRVWRYVAKNHRRRKFIPPEWRFEMAIPLLNKENVSLGILYLIRDLRKSPLSAYTIRRMESLRRSLIITIEKLQNQSAVEEKKAVNKTKVVSTRRRTASFLTRFLS